MLKLIFFSLQNLHLMQILCDDAITSQHLATKYGRIELAQENLVKQRQATALYSSLLSAQQVSSMHWARY